jgi:hypothetical protein
MKKVQAIKVYIADFEQEKRIADFSLARRYKQCLKCGDLLLL